jgi:putative exporter of polyketide antibiotics
LAANDVAHELPRLFVRTLETLPAIWVMVGIATLLFGFLPRFASAGTWAALAVFFVLELGWELQQSQAVFNLTVRLRTLVTPDCHPLIGLTLVVAGPPLTVRIQRRYCLTAVGVLKEYRRRS